MTDSVIGALRIDLAASSAAFDEGLSEAISALQAFGSAAQKQLGGIVQAFGTAGADGGELLQDRLGASLDGLKDTVFSKLSGLAAALPGVYGKVAALAVPALEQVWGALEPMLAANLHATLFDAGMWNQLTDVTARLAGTFGGLFDGAIGKILEWRKSIVDAWSNAESLLGGVASALHAAFVTPFAPAFDAVWRYWGQIGEAWSSSGGVLSGIGNALHAAFVQPVMDAMGAIARWATAVQEAWTSADGFIAGLGAAMGKALTYPFASSEEALKASSAAAADWEKIWREKMAAAGQATKDFLALRAGIEQPPVTPDNGSGRAGAVAAPPIDRIAEFSRRLDEMIDKSRTEMQVTGLGAEARARANAELQMNNLLRKEGLTLDPKVEAGLRNQIALLGEQAAATEQARQRMADLRQIGGVFQSSFSSAFDKVIDGTFKFKDALGDLAKQLAKTVMQQGIAQLVGSILGGPTGGTGGGLLAGLFGGRASGGPVEAGRIYRVNEMGSEYFQPNVPGRVIPAHESDVQAGGSAVVNVTINAPGADAAGLARVEEEVRQLRKSIPSMVVSSFNDARSRRMIR